jgi:hypothetical protein
VVTGGEIWLDGQAYRDIHHFAALYENSLNDAMDADERG